VIELITDKRTFEECQDLVDEILSTEHWKDRLSGVNGAVLGHSKERCWSFDLGTADGRGTYIYVSRDNPAELPFALVVDPTTGEEVRRHVDPKTGQWVEDFTENVR
jgi:hypothetical protein